MAKMVDIEIPATPTKLTGLFIKDAPLEKVEELQKMGEDDDPDKMVNSVLFMFQNFCCDENGEDFEDIEDVAAVRKLGILRIKAISDAVKEALDMSGNG